MGILTEDMKRVVREQRLGFIATVCPDGSPNLSPKGTMKVWDDDHLAFANICSPGTIANLKLNPAIEINLVDPFVRKGYRFKGTAEVHDQGPVLEEFMRLYTGGESQMRTGVAALIQAAVLVRVETAARLVSPGYIGDITEGQMRDQWEAYFAGIRP
ncbi:MAG: pyridoxamine 5'-phosphate oxidase family protein [Dehalococcoidia bacterium]